MKLLGYNINRTPEQQQEKRKKKRLSDDAVKTPIDRIEMQMNNLKIAVDSAQSVFAPNRESLILIYDQAAKDDEVISQMRTARIFITGAPFVLRNGTADNEEVTKILQKSWFTKYLEFVLSAEFYGYTLVEFGDLINGEFTDVKLFPRRHVNPINKNILVYPKHQTGLYYGDRPTDYFLIEIGDPEDLGLMEVISRLVIWKNFALVDWSQFNETYGKPIAHLKMDSDDPIEVSKRASALNNFGSNRWIITDLDEELVLVEPKSGVANGANFNNLADRCDKKISKIINGQSNAGNEQAFVGSAEVSERILNEYTRDRLKLIQTHVNEVLIPFLKRYGYPLDGLTFHFTELDEKNPDVGTGQSNDDGPGTGQQQAQNKFNTFPVLDKKKIYNLKVDRLLEDYLQRLYDGADDLFDSEVWQLNFAQISKGIELGYGVSFAEATATDAALAFQLRENAAVYAAFKNHTEQTELVKLLVDSSGKLKSFADFKRDALPITEKYNKTWLETEFNQAEANARMAKKWEGFKENADIYPNLQYRAINDDRTRPEHRALNGIVLPMNDPFWNTHYPPLGWGCRCSVTQTDKPVKQVSGNMPEVSEGFDNNPGKTGKLWSDNNAYASAIDQGAKMLIEEKARRMMND